ncbi:MAG TPA: hypothetical protein VFL12_08820 [Thermoanaerobaculia bacterium]|nr:hypothetical protein [Thermoanaerobaculia bacterium]
MSIVGLRTTSLILGALALAGAADGGPIVDTSPPSCTLAETIPGPPRELRITIQDTGSGLASLSVTKAVNAEMSLPPYAFGVTIAIPVVATKIDPFAAMDVALESSDVEGNTGSCEFTDPAAPTVPAASAGALAILAAVIAVYGAKKLP